MKELTVALINTKNNKSPGIDGYLIEFFKFFWKDLGNFVLNALNFSYVTGNLSISLKRGVITSISKQNKCRFYLNIRRPISLLDAVYKLAASCIANRIKPVLGQIINENKGLLREDILDRIFVWYMMHCFTQNYNLNPDYFFSCIANRIKPVLGQIINENQKGFIKGRYIGENIRMVYDALFYATTTR